MEDDMKKQIALVALLISCSLAHAQQYGWVRVAQIGNQFTVLRSVEFVDSLNGWTAEGGSTIYKTTDGGTTWNGFPGDPMGVEDFSMLNKLYGWCVGEQASLGKILRTTNGGMAWTTQFQRNNRNLLGTSGLSLDKNITSGSTRNFSPDTGKVVQTTNGGTTWTERTIADSIRQLRQMQFLDSLRGWIIYWTDNNEGFIKTTDGGATWSYLRSPSLRAFHFIDSLRGWGFGADNQRIVYGTTNGGITWDSISVVTTDFEFFVASAVSFVDSNNGWMFGSVIEPGDLAAIYRTTDGGHTWSQEHQGGGSTGVTGIMLDLYHGWAVGTGGSVFAYRRLTTVPERVNELPRGFSLRQCYPNPFNPTTTIEYEIAQRSNAQLRVYDAAGKEVRELVNAHHEAGVYRITFDATGLASGVYYYTMKTESTQETKQMLFLK
jgi:photosystem II stability/assembly factor-like uncharacterized protein